MKSRTLTCITAISLFAALAVPLQLAAQRYIVTDIGTLGGTFTEANALNNKGWVVGDATLPGDTALHAILWRNGAPISARSEDRTAMQFSRSTRGARFGASPKLPLPTPWGKIFAVLETT